MDFAPFDKRHYPIVSAHAGYADWARSYDATVTEALDRPLLAALSRVAWNNVQAAADLACGTGRTGAWLSQHKVKFIDGVDLTPEMLRIAESTGVYRRLRLANVTTSGLLSSNYDLCTLVLADEHLAAVEPVYREAARLLIPAGYFVLIGYHPFFLMNGIPTHYHRADGSAVTIQSYIHLFSEHYRAGNSAGLKLIEFHERVVDEEWLLIKPKWREYLHWPVSFALVWRAS